ncbi:ECF RNA polymerase sigma factor SigH [Lacipirellula limnantheis]|uniref:ECF RNA polymerase sigma factor SigH n=2 Tax=Lacipirellula limnantheis TaxID=2528024 RepID=A0A517TRL9_9BACT|nr:ECF RNA polymerase sigma factor SigH [Lacipirellula limnantheis]
MGITATMRADSSNDAGEDRTRDDVAALIGRARRGSGDSLGRLLQMYRNYLMVLAGTQIERRLQPRMSPSDVVQETMLRAHANFGQFRGASEPELIGWLRQILVNNLAKFVEQHVLAARRDVRREVSIERLGRALEQSTIQLAALLPAGNRSPSAAAQQREEAVLLADRLAMLAPDYREVLILRNLQGLPFEKIAEQMERSVSATRMLWLRAIEKLRGLYAGEQSHEE